MIYCTSATISNTTTKTNIHNASYFTPQEEALDRSVEHVRRCLELAEAHHHSGLGSTAAILVYGKKTISIGVNQPKRSHPFQKRYSSLNDRKIFFHAEIAAIHKAVRASFGDFRRSTMYISRVKWDSPAKNYLIQGLAKPCAGCASCLAEFGVGRVAFTLNEKGFNTL